MNAPKSTELDLWAAVVALLDNEPNTFIVNGYPVRVAITGAGDTHQQQIGRVKRLLEDQGFDLATRGPAQRCCLAVYGRAANGGAA